MWIIALKLHYPLQNVIFFPQAVYNILEEKNYSFYARPIWERERERHTHIETEMAGKRQREINFMCILFSNILLSYTLSVQIL